MTLTCRLTFGWGTLGFGFLAALAGSACGAPREVAKPAEPPAAPRAAAASLPAARWETLTLPSLGLALPLPDGPGWASREDSTLGFRALHAATGAELRARSWPEQRSVTPEACLARARLAWPDLPAPGDPGLLDDRPLRAPEGYRGQVLVNVARRPDGALEGRLVAVGAGVGRCLALSFRTWAQGAGAERVVAESLAVIAEGTVDRLSIVSIEDRVPEEVER